MQERLRAFMGNSSTLPPTYEQQIEALHSRNVIEVKRPPNPYLEQLQTIESKIESLEKQIIAKDNLKQQLTLQIKAHLKNGKEPQALLLVKKKGTLDSDITMIMTAISKHEETASSLRKIVLIADTRETMRDTNPLIGKFIQTSENGDDLTDIIYDDKFNSASIEKMSSIFNVSYGDSYSNSAKESQDELAKMKLEMEQEENDQIMASMPRSNYQPQPLPHPQQQQQPINNNNKKKQPSLLEEFGLV